MGSTVHWHTHDDNMDLIKEMLEFWQFAMLDLKQMNDVPLIKVFEFCVELVRNF